MADIIALITDFGYKDAYTGVMKGVIYSVNSQVKIVDITHSVSPQNINEGAWMLYTSYKYFPFNTIFVCVVDPGVGSEREILLVQTHEYFFLAPDNGILSYIYRENQIQRIISIQNDNYFLDIISQTFHARDIFAPVAAHLSKDQSIIDNLGPQKDLKEVKKLNINACINHNMQIIGQIVHIDHFGNIISNIPADLYQTKQTKIQINGMFINKISATYTEVGMGEILAITGSHGFLEISARNGNASQLLKAKIGDELLLDLLDDL
jgi:S-adenosylmethionine hydrolase